MNIKIGQIYTDAEKPSSSPDFIITTIEPELRARNVDDEIDWKLNIGVIKSGYYRLLTKLEKALR